MEDINEYQTFASKGILNANNQDPLLNFALGLAGESGEVIDLIKKKIFQGRDIHPTNFEEELGDVLWYVANIASSVGLKLSDILKANVTKLEKRYQLREYSSRLTSDGTYIIRQNGPHIQLLDAVTGKHIKFLSKKEAEKFNETKSDVPWD